ncbi:MAG TPA: hypothetical protein VM658_18810 [bacterium]|nr:hypothetical protein [bacterium]
MSEPLRVAFVVEGTTDFILLKAIVALVLGGRDFISQTLQPEISEAFQALPSEYGFGWPGVCKWCLNTAEEGGGRVNNSALFLNHDLLIVQLDADVAGETYSRGNLEDPFPDPSLPCEEPCPPPEATTDRLRKLALRWMGERTLPPHSIICIPSQSLETWVLVGLFPNDGVVRRKDNIECRNHPERILQGKPRSRRLVSHGKKVLEKYNEVAEEFARSWDRIAGRCSEARRFNTELRSQIERISGQP